MSHLYYFLALGITQNAIAPIIIMATQKYRLDTNPWIIETKSKTVSTINANAVIWIIFIL